MVVVSEVVPDGLLVRMLAPDGRCLFLTLRVDPSFGLPVAGGREFSEGFGELRDLNDFRSYFLASSRLVQSSASPRVH